ncbi:MAG TPA: efflux RND transporter periplasmic adaptor subunit [Thermoanaerobaculia bacterium]|nr:efflux RND transporter periplasmic adaptor subunit [Thermoanaerobaculia bacterium]
MTSALVEPKTLPKTLAVTGALVADESADVAAERDGRVSRVLVERGSLVEKGAVLATLDDREAKATLQQARANLAWARSEVARYAELRKKQVVAKAEDERKSIDLDLAAAQLTLAEKAFEDCTIRAPFAGLVTEKKVSEGAFVRRGQSVAGLVKIEPLRAELAIPESAVGAVKVGQVVRLSVQSFPDRTFEGRIAYVGPSLRSEARTLVVEAHVPNAGHLLKPGLFATAEVELPVTVPVLLVPRAAVVTEAGVSRAFVLGTDRVSERLVALGERRGDDVEVRSGLAAGERVVLNPDRRLTDGLEVAR